MSIASLIDLGIGPGAKIRFLITGGLGASSAAGVIGQKKKKDTRQWHILPNGMRILATPENYQRFARKYPKVEETPAEPLAPAPEGVEEIAGSPSPSAQPEPLAEEKYEGPLLGETPKREFVSKEARGDPASLAAAAQTMAERLAAAQLAREIEEEDDAIVLELLLKDMAA